MQGGARIRVLARLLLEAFMCGIHALNPCAVCPPGGHNSTRADTVKTRVWAPLAWLVQARSRMDPFQHEGGGLSCCCDENQ